jgi:hypothetical protein
MEAWIAGSRFGGFGDDGAAERVCGSEYSVVAGEVLAGGRDQDGEPLQELEGGEGEVSATVVQRSAQLHYGVAVIVE